MIYLFFQTWIWMLLAGVLGLLIGWLIWGRDEESSGGTVSDSEDTTGSPVNHTVSVGEPNSLESAAVPQPASERLTSRPSSEASGDPGEPSVEHAGPKLDETNEAGPVRNSWKPESLESPAGAPDNLQRIKGVGPVIEKTLNNLGIYHFYQIAGFTDENIKWVDNYISFPGRIQREQWVAQAGKLADDKGP